MDLIDLFSYNLGIPFYLKLNAGWDNNSIRRLELFLYRHTTEKSVKTYYELSVINLNGKDSRVRHINKTFEKSQESWGFDDFIKQKELTGLGFVKNDAILVKVYLEVLS